MSMTYIETLTLVHCWNCGIAFGLTDHYDAKRRNDHEAFHCPNGHKNYYTGKSEAEKERERAERAERGLANARDDLQVERLSHRATKGVLTKTKKRVANGVCPCCNRTFANLGKHMSGQHPDYAEASHS